MKNFFKNLFGKKYPQRTDDSPAHMKVVYAGPKQMKKNMQGVYAGPEMMNNNTEIREVYAGPPRPETPSPETDTEQFMAVYAGPPSASEQIEEIDATDTLNQYNPGMMMVYYGPMGPNNNAEKMMVFYNSTDPNNNAFMNSLQSQMSLSTVVCRKCSQINDSSETVCKYCGAPLQDTASQSPSTGPEESADGYKICPTCGYKLPPNQKYCNNCGMDTSNVEIIKPGDNV